MNVGDEVLVTATREVGTVHQVDRIGDARLYWLRMASLDRSKAPMDLGGPFASDELRPERRRH